MKKVLLIAVIGAFSFVSCKKDYTCSCTSAANPSANVDVEILKSKKGDAEDTCADQATVYQASFSDMVCESSKK